MSLVSGPIDTDLEPNLGREEGLDSTIPTWGHEAFGSRWSFHPQSLSSPFSKLVREGRTGLNKGCSHHEVSMLAHSEKSSTWCTQYFGIATRLFHECYTALPTIIAQQPLNAMTSDQNYII